MYLIKEIQVKNILALFLVSAVLFAFSQPANKRLPDVTITDLQGKPVNIQEFASNGQVTILSFWATWCAPCKRELDAISELYPQWTEDYNTRLIAITIDNARPWRLARWTSCSSRSQR